MPKLAIIDQDVAAAGGENFTKGLISGLQKLPEIKDWQVTVVTRRRNSAGYDAAWQDHVSAGNFRLVYLRDDPVRRAFDHLAAAGRICGIKGSSKAQQIIPRLLKRYGPPAVKELAGDVRLWVEPFCKREKFDVVYFPFPYMVSCPEIQSPLVCTPHDFNYRKTESMESWHRAQMEEQVPIWLERCRHLVVSTQSIADEMKELYPKYAHKAKVIHTGIFSGTTTVSQSDVARFRAGHNLPEKFFLTAGWFLPHKNQKVVFEAIGKLKSEGKNVCLVCTGPNSYQIARNYTGWTSPYVDEILSVAKSYGLVAGEDFFAMGYLDKKDLECLYRLAQALIIPSLYEGGCLPMLEAMQAGCPVVCSNIATIAELAALAGGNAWCFDATDADELKNVLLQFLSNPSAVEDKAAAAARLVPEVFSWEKSAAAYLQLFSEAAGN